MELGLVGQAVGMFTATNVDDLVILALFFGRGGGRAVVAGQYLGFGAILAASIAGALGVGLLPDAVLPYLGLLPLALGVRAAWQVWRDRGVADDEEASTVGRPSILGVAAVTVANGGDNIGVYVPVFANTGARALVGYTVVFLVLVGAWCALGRYLATRPAIARVLSRWGHLVLPVVLIGLGVLILVGGL